MGKRLKNFESIKVVKKIVKHRQMRMSNENVKALDNAITTIERQYTEATKKPLTSYAKDGLLHDALNIADRAGRKTVDENDIKLLKSITKGLLKG